MPKTPHNLGPLPSLLSRLRDDQPDQPAQARIDAWNIEGVIEEIRLDLEALLNTRRSPACENLPAGSETKNSIMAYGLPDFSSFNLKSDADRFKLRKMIEETIGLFEPRLQRVRVSFSPVAPFDHILRFTIEGVAALEPAPERVVFDTALDMNSRVYKVQEAA